MNLFKYYFKEFIGTAALEIRFSEEKGRALFATKHFAEGDTVFYEPPFISCPDFRNSERNFCFTTLQPLFPPQIRFLNAETESLFSELTEERKNELKSQMITQLNIPQLNPKTCQYCGIVKFSNGEAENMACENILPGICDKMCHKNPRLKVLLPSIFDPEYGGLQDEEKRLNIHQ